MEIIVLRLRARTKMLPCLIPSVILSSLTRRDKLRPDMNPSGIAPQKRSWVPHPSLFLRWVGYGQAHLARSSGAV